MGLGAGCQQFSLSLLVSLPPLPLHSLPFLSAPTSHHGFQVSEVTVTGRPPEEGDVTRSSPPVTFTEVPQAPAIRIPLSSSLCALGRSPRDQASGPDASEGAAGPLLEPSQ